MPRFVSGCLARRLAIVPGSAFMTGDAPCRSVRLNFSTPTRAQIEEGTAILAGVLAELGG